MTLHLRRAATLRGRSPGDEWFEIDGNTQVVGDMDESHAGSVSQPTGKRFRQRFHLLGLIKTLHEKLKLYLLESHFIPELTGHLNRSRFLCKIFHDMNLGHG